MKSKLYILKKIIICNLLFVILFPYSCALAATVEETQQAIASYAKNFQSAHASEVEWYDVGAYGSVYRDNAYLSQKKYDASVVYAPVSGQKYLMDCVGWVSFCIHYATGLDCGINNSTIGNWLCFASPQSGSNSQYLSAVSSSNLQAGDILYNSHHIVVYVGNNQVVESSYSGGGLLLTHLDNVTAEYPYVLRVNQTAADNVTNLDYGGEPINVDSDGGGSSSDSGNGSNSGFESNSGTNYGGEYRTSEFYYNGIPDGKYSVSKTVWQRIVESISGIFDFLLGLATLAVRMVFVGWAAIIENLITFTVKTVVGRGELETIPVTRTEIDSTDNITIEKIVFNQMGIFDVNFFNYNDQTSETTETSENNGTSETETE